MKKRAIVRISGCGGVFAMAPKVLAIDRNPASAPGYPAGHAYGQHGTAGASAAHFGYGMGSGFMGYGMWIGGILWLFFLVALIVLVVLVVRAMLSNRSQPRGTQANQGRALQLLDERYARGEISREEYLEKKQDLSR